MITKLQSITKGSQIIDKIFWELLSGKAGSRFAGKFSTELDLVRFIKRRANQLGASGMAFPPIVSFGKNSAEIHHKPNKTKIGCNNFLMLDYGVKVNGYCSDFTRTLFIGTPNKFQEKVYNIVLKAQLAALKKVKIGADCADIDLVARNIIASAGFAKNYNHSTGHGVGRRIHEPPGFTPYSTFQIPCLAGRRANSTIMTVEPGIYLPGQFGVRIEDMIIVGQKKIMSKVPKDFESMIIS